MGHGVGVWGRAQGDCRRGGDCGGRVVEEPRGAMEGGALWGDGRSLLRAGGTSWGGGGTLWGAGGSSWGDGRASRGGGGRPRGGPGRLPALRLPAPRRSPAVPRPGGGGRGRPGAPCGRGPQPLPSPWRRLKQAAAAAPPASELGAGR